MLLEKVAPDKQEEYEAMMKPLADSVFAAKDKPDSDPSMIFFTAKTADDRIANQLRSMTNTSAPEEGKAQMILMDVAAGGKYYIFPPGEVTKASIGNFVEFFKAGALEQQQLSR